MDSKSLVFRLFTYGTAFPKNYYPPNLSQCSLEQTINLHAKVRIIIFLDILYLHILNLDSLLDLTFILLYLIVIFTLNITKAYTQIISISIYITFFYKNLLKPSLEGDIFAISVKFSLSFVISEDGTAVKLDRIIIYEYQCF